jgi:serine/threonine-protein kinase
MALIAALLVALAVGLFFLGRSLGWWDSTRTLTVPTDVVNKPAATAMTELHQQGFTNVSSRAETSSVTPGNVVTTDPVPGTRMRSNKPLVLLVSSGPVQVPVPNVVGQPEATATATLKDAGFEVNKTTAASPTVAAGTVISTNPPAHTSRAKGSAVQLVVSTGKPQVTIPYLVGETPTQAGQTLGALGLKVYQSNETSSLIPAGQVTRTNPSSGSQVPIDSHVTVFVSIGVPQVAVPNLTGHTEAAANTALQTAGLAGNFTTTPVTNSAQNGLVQSQSPGPNVNVNQGSTVNVVIGSYTAPTTTTSSTSTTQAPTTTTSTTTAPTPGT